MHQIAPAAISRSSCVPTCTPVRRIHELEEALTLAQAGGGGGSGAAADIARDEETGQSVRNH